MTIGSYTFWPRNASSQRSNLVRGMWTTFARPAPQNLLAYFKASVREWPKGQTKQSAKLIGNLIWTNALGPVPKWCASFPYLSNTRSNSKYSLLLEYLTVS